VWLYREGEASEGRGGVEGRAGRGKAGSSQGRVVCVDESASDVLVRSASKQAK
jgi:hypothetical protein